MEYFVSEVSFNSHDFHDLGFDHEKWVFNNDTIQTPHGELNIESFTEVKQGQLVGIQISTFGELSLNDFDDYDGDDMVMKRMLKSELSQ